MRADRLLSILLILQQRREATAGELSRELGVSVRTIARDLETLSMAGIPLYAERGVGGGWRLVEDYHTDLTGMTQPELQSLRLLNIPEALGVLEVGAELRSALLKLFAAASRRAESGSGQGQFILLDWAEKEHLLEDKTHLRLLHTALRESRQVRLHYRYANFIDVEQSVDPCGLVASGGLWYLIYAIQGRIRAEAITELIEIQLLDTRSQRSDNFDLADAWRRLKAEMAVKQGFRVRLRMSPRMCNWLEVLQKGRAFQIGKLESGGDPGGWRQVELFFENLESARREILAWGGSVEVLEPRALRLSVSDYAAQILRRYQND